MLGKRNGFFLAMELWGFIDSIFGIGRFRVVEWNFVEFLWWILGGSLRFFRLIHPKMNKTSSSVSLRSLFVSKQLFQIRNGAAHNQCLPFPWKIGILIDLFLPNTLNDSNLTRVQAYLVGRFKYVFNVHPDAWGHDPVLTIVLCLSIFQECGEQPEVLLCVWCST